MTRSADPLLILAPLQGWSTPLEEAPDAVFARRMLGDGLAIDPTSAVLHAPCDGTLIVVAESRHAVTLRSANGAEILLHVGIDTVHLGGQGFDLHVQSGQRVRAGEPLISFDLDLLARRAKSVLTPVILTNGDGFRVARRYPDRLLQVGAPLMEIEPLPLDPAPLPPVPRGASSLQSVTTAGITTGSEAALEPHSRREATLSRTLIVPFEHGIHARPAATLAAAVKAFATEITISRAGRKANAKSPVALMSLGVRRGDSIDIEATGIDAPAAIEALARTLLAPLDSTERARAANDITAAQRSRAQLQPPTENSAEAEKSAEAANSRHTENSALAKNSPAGALPGVVASRGLAVGRAFQLRGVIAEVRESGSGEEPERAQLDHALAAVRDELQKAAASGNDSARSIAAAHLELIEDPELIRSARGSIAAGQSAGYAWRQALQAAIDALRALGDARMAERADDLLDLQMRVLEVLTGRQSALPDLPQDAILIAAELLPSQLLKLDPRKLAGIALAGGGPTSHVAIIAAAMQLPMLVALGPAALGIPHGRTLVLDADSARLLIQPAADEIEQARCELASRGTRRAAEQQAARKKCRTADGTRIDTLANLGSLLEAEAAMRLGAEGCGLLRTEFLFLERTAPPDESEQMQRYQEIAAALQGRPITIRTLDSGGDKPIPYLPLPHEDNPALGMRGVRMSLWRPDLLRTQLRAVLQVRPPRQCRIMLPMIIDPTEIRAVRTMLDELQAEIGRTIPIALGVMIETPAAALMADRIAREADFLSIGTNDLTQYTLCIDRDHGQLGAKLDALHPAVLRLIAQCVTAARGANCGVAVCGGLASEPLAVPILIGLGIRELSMVPSVIPRMKALIARVDVGLCEQLARSALDEPSAERIRSLVSARIAQLDHA